MVHVQNWPSPQIHYLYANRQYSPPPKLLCARQLSLLPRRLLPAHMHWLCLLAWRLLLLPQPCHLLQRLPCTHQLYPSARLGPSAWQPSPMHQCHHLVEQLLLTPLSLTAPQMRLIQLLSPITPTAMHVFSAAIPAASPSPVEAAETQTSHDLTHDFWTRTGGWEFDRSHGTATSSPSHWQQVEEQAPKPVGLMMCFLLMTLVAVQKLCVNIYICIPYMSSVIGRIYIYTYIYIYNGSVIQYWRSCTPSRSIGLYSWGVRGSWAECHFLFSLVYQLCLALW